MIHLNDIHELSILIGKLEALDNEMPEGINSERLYCSIEQAYGLVNKKIEMCQCEYKAMQHEIAVLRESLDKERRRTMALHHHLEDCKCHNDEPSEEVPNFTRSQVDYICFQIGDWYMEWKSKLVNYDERTHQLGVAKEQLKEKICG